MSHHYQSDGGWKSRKMWMAYVAMVLILGGYLVSGYWTTLHVVYPEYVMGILAATSIFTAGNAGVKWMGRSATPPPETPAKPVPPPSAPAPKVVVAKSQSAAVVGSASRPVPSAEPADPLSGVEGSGGTGGSAAL